jgi:NADH-quinone oxidoreductase E subunit
MSFPETLTQKADEIVARYPQKRSAILPLLHLVQNEENRISEDGMRFVAKKLGLNMNDVYEVLTFYSMFFTDEIGKYHIQLCRTISCFLCGAGQLREHLEKKLGIKPGQKTPDGRFRLSEVECIGSCSTAPAMQINFDFHENLTPEKIDAILDALP